MSVYEPGTVAVATVRGQRDVSVFRCAASTTPWSSAERVDGCISHTERDVTDIRPLVVLDLGDYSGERAVNYLRNLAGESRDVCGNSPSPRGKLALFIADQIDAQTKPPRIPEPGLWGVVEATWSGNGETGIPRAEWVRVKGNRWASCISNIHAAWSDLIDPTLIREGLS